MEKYIFKSVLWTLFFVIVTATVENSNNLDEVRALAAEVAEMKTSHFKEVSALKKEIEELKHGYKGGRAGKSVHAAIRELRSQLRAVNRIGNTTHMIREMTSMHRELNLAVTKCSDAAEHSHRMKIRTQAINDQINGLSVDYQQLRTMLTDVRQEFLKVAKEVREIEAPAVPEVEDNVIHREPHKMRHGKSVHHQISKLMKIQNQMQQNQHALRFTCLDTEKRVEKLERYDYDTLSNMINFSELRIKAIQDYFRNISYRVADLDKIHTSLLELREEVEEIENKADKTLPEFRKEISKLDVNIAQITARVSYLKEGQENLRQSVKAIAVSVSNTMDRAEADREFVRHINDSVAALQHNTKQHYHRLNDHILKAETNFVVANHTEDIPLPVLMDEVKELEPVEQEYKQLISKLPRDCSTISGPPKTYIIHPGRTPIDTWCVNGSTVIQRRYNGSIEFNRKFSEYVKGFGNPASEYWLGLEGMHMLTADNCSAMRIDMTDIYGGFWYAEYDHFYVGSSDTGYTLEVSGFKGNASDAFEYQNHMEFSAIDHDRDISNTHCAGNYEGGWWFSHCQHVNINGKYSLGLTWFDSGKNEWIAVATSEMRMYRTC